MEEISDRHNRLDGVQTFGRIWRKEELRPETVLPLSAPYSRYVISSWGRIGSYAHHNTQSKKKEIRWLRSDNEMCRIRNKKKICRLYSDNKGEKVLTITPSSLIVKYFIYKEYDSKLRKHMAIHIDNDTNNHCVTNLRVVLWGDGLRIVNKGGHLQGRKLICIETGEVFKSKNNLCSRIKVSSYKIDCHLRGILPNINSLHYRYYDE